MFNATDSIFFIGLYLAQVSEFFLVQLETTFMPFNFLLILSTIFNHFPVLLFIANKLITLDVNFIINSPNFLVCRSQFFFD